jgi:CheY-like chemotaxis protein
VRSTSIAQSSSLKPLRVLVLDDEPGILRMFRTALNNCGYSTEMVGNASAALDALARERFDIVVSDIHMPGCGGLEFVRSVRQRFDRIPVILMTGRPSPETSKQALALGVVRCLTKPVMPQTLREAIERATGRWDAAE